MIRRASTVGLCLAVSLAWAAGASAGPVNADGEPLHLATTSPAAVAPAGAPSPVPASRALQSSDRGLQLPPTVPADGESSRLGVPEAVGALVATLMLVALTVLTGTLGSGRRQS